MFSCSLETQYGALSIYSQNTLRGQAWLTHEEAYMVRNIVGKSIDFVLS
jgi:hypothetical protein